MDTAESHGQGLGSQLDLSHSGTDGRNVHQTSEKAQLSGRGNSNPHNNRALHVPSRRRNASRVTQNAHLYPNVGHEWNNRGSSLGKHGTKTTKRDYGPAIAILTLIR